MNIFQKKKVAHEYDSYYTTEQGKEIDALEKQAIQDLINPIIPGKLLEIGCGTGHWTSFFSQQGFQVTATDISEAMLQQIRAKSLPNVKLFNADVLQLPFPDDHFDQVAVITALEFCGNIPQAMSEIKRVLKPDGWLIAGCLNADSTLGKIKNQDPVYKHGDFMTQSILKKQLSSIGKPTITESVFLSSDLKLLDQQSSQPTIAGVFMAAVVQKQKQCTSQSK
jgi:ubiquinone/menaquinone biosynthesis C-methylase UbiE